MNIKLLLPALLLFKGATLFAQTPSKHAFGDHLFLGLHYGFSQDYIGEDRELFDIAHFSGIRAGISLTRHWYAGIQSRFVRARNFETPAHNFYMAGIFTRGYFVHPAKQSASNRFGVFLESGFMMGNYAYENRNSVEYAFEQPGSWYIPIVLGAEYRVWRQLTLEGSMNLIYNNGGNWDQQGIAYLSLGANWHW